MQYNLRAVELPQIRKYIEQQQVNSVVAIAQLVEPRIVIPVVAGSSPVIHPILLSRVTSQKDT